MTLETLFLYTVITAIILLLIYEVVFILFFKDVEVAPTVAVVEPVEVMKQPQPLGYSEPPSSKIQQCNTPMFELSEVQNTVDFKVDIEDAKETVVPLVETVRKNSTGKAPTIVVSSPTV